jgi:hypothetical protein
LLRVLRTNHTAQRKHRSKEDSDEQTRTLSFHRETPYEKD